MTEVTKAERQKVKGGNERMSFSCKLNAAGRQVNNYDYD